MLDHLSTKRFPLWAMKLPLLLSFISNPPLPTRRNIHLDKVHATDHSVFVLVFCSLFPISKDVHSYQDGLL